MLPNFVGQVDYVCHQPLVDGPFRGVEISPRPTVRTESATAVFECSKVNIGVEFRANHRHEFRSELN